MTAGCPDMALAPSPSAYSCASLILKQKQYQHMRNQLAVDLWQVIALTHSTGIQYS